MNAPRPAPNRGDWVIALALGLCIGVVLFLSMVGGV